MSELLQDDAQLSLGFSPLRERTRADISIAANNLLSSTCLADKDAVRHISRQFAAQDLIALQSSQLNHFSTPIATTGVLAWLKDAAPEDADEFTAWIDGRTSQLQQQLERDQPALHESAEEYMGHLIKADLYPREALSAIRSSFTIFALRAINSLDPQCARGYFDDQYIGLANLYQQPDTMQGIGITLREVHFHERDHSLGDLPLLINEVVASHNTAVALAIAAGEAGEPEILDPRHRTSALGNEYYPLERRVFADIAAYAGLTPDMIAKARLGSKGSAIYDKVAHELITSYDDIVGTRGAFNHLLRDYTNAPSRHHKQQLLWTAYDALHPPLAI